MKEYRLLVMSSSFRIRVVSLIGKPGWEPKLYEPVPEERRQYAAETISEDQCLSDSDIVVGMLREGEYPNTFGLVAALEKFDEVTGSSNPNKNLDLLNAILDQTHHELEEMFLKKPEMWGRFQLMIQAYAGLKEITRQA